MSAAAGQLPTFGMIAFTLVAGVAIEVMAPRADKWLADRGLIERVPTGETISVTVEQDCLPETPLGMVNEFGEWKPLAPVAEFTL